MLHWQRIHFRRRFLSCCPDMNANLPSFRNTTLRYETRIPTSQNTARACMNGHYATRRHQPQPACPPRSPNRDTGSHPNENRLMRQRPPQRPLPMEKTQQI
jgi:hypothetical protein